MFGGKTTKPQNRIDSLIGETTTVEGNVIFTGGLRVDGRVKGSVLASDDQPSTLVLSERARAWEDDQLHVRHSLIRLNVERMLDAYMPGSPTMPAADVKQRLEEVRFEAEELRRYITSA